MLLSTCNRVEIYAVSLRPSHCARELRHFLSQSRGVPLEELDGALYEHHDAPALRHIYSVASSLDAIVVGEAQISGQVKSAYLTASRCGAVGSLLGRCMHRAFATAKRIRTETEIARHPVSVSSVATDLAGRVFGDLSGSTTLVIGAGEMAELAVRHLLSSGATEIRIVNRTHERAVQMAFQLGARAAPFAQLRGQLLLADIVITSTGSSEPILSRALISEVMRARKQRPLVLVDIAVPRDVERAVSALPNVYLFDVDDLEEVVAENMRERRREARKARKILDEEVAHFEDWLRRQDAVPVIKQLRQHFYEVAHAEVEHSAHALHLSGEKQRQVLDAMANAIVNKLLHHPTMMLKNTASRPDGTFLAQAARRLFGLPERGEYDARGEGAPAVGGEELEEES